MEETNHDFIAMDDSRKPFVSVCVPTYKRPEFLSEFLWCYLRQSYPEDRRELIILDDAGQYLSRIDPFRNIKLISLKRRFKTLGEKRNAFVPLMDDRSDFIVVADDDDLYFPHWLDTLMRAGSHADSILPSMMIEWRNGGEPEYRYAIGWSFQHAGCAFRKSAFTALGGYPHQQRQEDNVLFSKFEKNKERYNKVEIDWREFPYVIRRSGRWRGTYTTTSMSKSEYEATTNQPCSRGLVLEPVSAEKYLRRAKNLSDCRFENDVIAVRSAVVGYGALGIDRLGFADLDIPDDISTEKYTVLSSHCPSRLEITLKKRAAIRCIMNGSTRRSPSRPCLFSISGKTVGYLFGPKDRTEEFFLDPGNHTFETHSSAPNWKHSLWAVRPARIDEGPPSGMNSVLR